MADGYPQIMLERNTGPLGQRWRISVDDARGGYEGGAPDLDTALAIVRERWGAIERMHAADAARAKQEK